MKATGNALLDLEVTKDDVDGIAQILKEALEDSSEYSNDELAQSLVEVSSVVCDLVFSVKDALRKVRTESAENDQFIADALKQVVASVGAATDSIVEIRKKVLAINSRLMAVENFVNMVRIASKKDEPR